MSLDKTALYSMSPDKTALYSMSLDKTALYSMSLDKTALYAVAGFAPLELHFQQIQQILHNFSN